MAEPKAAKAKKSKGPDLPPKVYPDSAADRLFREDPFSRLLILADIERRLSDTRNNGDRRFPVSATPAEMARLESLGSALSAMGIYAFHGRHIDADGEKRIDETLKELTSEYPGLEGLTLAKFTSLGRRSNHRHGYYNDARPDPGQREYDAALQVLTQAVMGELMKSAPAKIADDQLEAALASGRAALSEKAGFDVSLLDALKEDKTLCLALTRVAFGGPTELSAVNQLGRNYEDLIQDVRRYSHRQKAEDLAPAWPAGHPLSGVVFAENSSARPFSELAAAAAALRAQGEWGAKARAAIARLTDTVESGPSSWDAMPPSGEAAYFNPEKQQPHQAKRLPGVSARGEQLKMALGQLGDIASWRTPVKAVGWGVRPGLKYAQALAQEAKAHQQKAPESLARALDELAARPSLRLEISSAFAARVAAGFSSLPEGAETEDFFPDLAAFRDDAEGPVFRAGDMSKVDPMGGVALAASKALGFTSHDPLALIGEAKRALADQVGLTPAAWKGMAASPDLAKAFEKMMTGIKKPVVRRGGALKAAAEIMKAADVDGSAFSKALESVRRREDKMTIPEAAGRALSACATGGVATEAQARLLSFLAQNESARVIVSGRLPGLPEGWDAHHRYYPGERPGEGFEPEADKAALLQADIEALTERCPAIARGLSERLERARAKSLKGGASEEQATLAAHEQLSALMSDIEDTSKGQPAGFWAGLDKKDPIASAMRQHEAWAAQARERQAQANPSLRRQWRAEAGALRHGRVEAVELSVGMDLFDEGKAMSHCVGSYADRCASGQSRIFSVRIGGLRQSTLELAPCSKAGGSADISRFDAEDPASRAKVKGWAISQNRGKHNALNLTPEVKEACERFAQDYAVAFQANTELIVKRLQEERQAAVSAKAAAKASESGADSAAEGKKKTAPSI